MELAEQVKAKLEAERVRRNQKIALLKGLDTKKLVDLLSDFEKKLEFALREEAKLRDLNSGYLTAQGSDCAEVKRILAELNVRIPEAWSGESPSDKVGKKMTAPDREAWLVLQRTSNLELVAAINRQKSVSFQLENCRIDQEMAKKRLEGIRAVLGLKTAQIHFLRPEGGE